jgi:NAD(P)-dependent dehydrogenase (short-subunit alcohol dehydrogenase family)
LAFVKAYASQGWNVIATCRTPEDARQLKALAANNAYITIEQLDVTDLERIKALADQYKHQAIDILLNNAGIQGDVNAQKLGSLDYDTFRRVVDVNSFAPLAMADAFLPHVEASKTKKIINISSYMGSIEKTFGILYFYRASKAALNMHMKTLARETRSRGIIVGLLDPGIVDTDLTPNWKGPKRMSADKSVAAMLPLIEAYNKSNSGAFYRYDGKELPW